MSVCPFGHKMIRAHKALSFSLMSVSDLFSFHHSIGQMDPKILFYDHLPGKILQTEVSVV